MADSDGSGNIIQHACLSVSCYLQFCTRSIVATGGSHDLPEEGVVPVPAAVVAHNSRQVLGDLIGTYCLVQADCRGMRYG